jgi:hypothetical protein
MNVNADEYTVPGFWMTARSRLTLLGRSSRNAANELARLFCDATTAGDPA